MSEKAESNRKKSFMRKTYSIAKEGARPLGREVASTAVLTAGLAGLITLENDSIRALKEAARHGTHAYITASDISRGGTEGQIATEKYSDSLTLARLKAEIERDEVLKTELLGAIDKRLELVDTMKATYEANETMNREFERLSAQLEGLAAEITVAGDEAAGAVTGGASKKVDDAIMNLAGKVAAKITGKSNEVGAEEAREGTSRLQEFYRTLREYSDTRVKLDRTIGEANTNLEGQIELSNLQNQRINTALDILTNPLKETYDVEDKVMEGYDRVSLYRALRRMINGDEQKGPLTREGLDEIKSGVSEHRENVDWARTVAEEPASLGPYRNPTGWVDSIYGINPLTIGLLGALTIKGLASFSGTTRKGLTYATLLPVKIATYASRKIKEGVNKIQDEKLKKSKGGTNA